MVRGVLGLQVLGRGFRDPIEDETLGKKALGGSVTLLLGFLGV